MLETDLLPSLLQTTPINDKKTSQFVLDMKRVDWVDLFPLAVLTLTLYELAGSWESVRVLPPHTSPILPDEAVPGL